jgi:putative transposase
VPALYPINICREIIRASLRVFLSTLPNAASTGETFSSDVDRATYLKLMFHVLPEAGVRLLGWCLMPNHVHLIAIPSDENSLAVLLRRVHGRYAQYYNAKAGRIGHLWQNRYFSCMLGPGHLVRALLYVDLNPVRGGLVQSAASYVWSSAAAHARGADATGLMDIQGWRSLDAAGRWAATLCEREESNSEYTELRRCTFAGRPFGGREFIGEMGRPFDRRWRCGSSRCAELRNAVGNH